MLIDSIDYANEMYSLYKTDDDEIFEELNKKCLELISLPLCGRLRRRIDEILGRKGELLASGAHAAELKTFAESSLRELKGMEADLQVSKILFESNQHDFNLQADRILADIKSTQLQPKTFMMTDFATAQVREETLGAMMTLHYTAKAVHFVGDTIYTVAKAICGITPETKEACKVALRTIADAGKTVLEFTHLKEPTKQALDYLKSCDGALVAAVLEDMGVPSDVAHEQAQALLPDILTVTAAAIPLPLAPIIQPVAKGVSTTFKNLSTRIATLTAKEAAHIPPATLLAIEGTAKQSFDRLILPTESTPIENVILEGLASQPKLSPAALETSATGSASNFPFALSKNDATSAAFESVKSKTVRELSQEHHLRGLDEKKFVQELASIEPKVVLPQGFAPHFNKFRSICQGYRFSQGGLGANGGAGSVNGYLPFQIVGSDVLIVLHQAIRDMPAIREMAPQTMRRSIKNAGAEWDTKVQAIVKSAVELAEIKNLDRIFIAWNSEKLPLAMALKKDSLYTFEGIGEFSMGLSKRPYSLIEIKR